MADPRDSGAFSLAQQDFVSRSAELWHGGVQMALAAQRCAGDGSKPGWVILTCQSCLHSLLRVWGGEAEQGIDPEQGHTNPVTLLEQLGWSGRASRVGLNAEKDLGNADGLGKTDFPLQKSALRVHVAAGAWQLWADQGL